MTHPHAPGPFGRVALATVLALAACSSPDDQPGPPAAVEVVSGANQQAAVATTVPVAPAVRVRDADGNALSGVVVKFTVQTGGGTVTGDSVRTSTSGVATLGSWKLGPSSGVQTLRATAQGTGFGATISATAEAGPPAILIAITPQQNASLVATTVTPLPTVEARDAFGNILAGVPVSFTVTLGGGSVTGESQVTDANGRATVGSWTLGQSSGLNRLTARAGSNASFIFEAQGLGAAPVSVSAESPTTQAGYLRAMVPKIPRVIVRDEFGNPSPGITVRFAIVGGGDATLTGGEAITGLDGIAAPSDWRLGFVASSTVEATVVNFDMPKVTFQATGVAAPFLIDVRFIAPPGADDRDAFATAAKRWMDIIIGDIPDVSVTRGAGNACWTGFPNPAINETVDDVIVYAFVTTMDGPGGKLGQAGSCVERSTSQLSAVGAMEFDVADMVNLRVSNRLEPVITHEMGHVLGISQWTWSPRGLLTDGGTSDPIFTGLQANSVWPSFSTGYIGRPVPVHNADGAGSADSHWRESVLGDELMTPFVEAAGVFMPLSKLTIASLADLGYSVDLTRADPFLSNLRMPSALTAQYPEFLLNEVVHRPRFKVDPSGTITPIN